MDSEVGFKARRSLTLRVRDDVTRHVEAAAGEPRHRTKIGMKVSERNGLKAKGM